MQINPLFQTVLAAVPTLGYDENPEPTEGSEPLEFCDFLELEVPFERVPEPERQLQQTG